MDNASVEQRIAALGVSLTETLAKNAASAIYTKIRAARADRDTKETANQLVEIINDLLDDKDTLGSIARSYQEELVFRASSHGHDTHLICNLAEGPCIPTHEPLLHLWAVPSCRKIWLTSLTTKCSAAIQTPFWRSCDSQRCVVAALYQR
jgi:hypothetical protein